MISSSTCSSTPPEDLLVQALYNGARCLAIQTEVEAAPTAPSNPRSLLIWLLKVMLWNNVLETNGREHDVLAMHISQQANVLHVQTISLMGS